VGFGLAHARAMTLREALLRLNEAVTGHRLLRGALGPGRTALRRLPTDQELSRMAIELEALVELALSNTVVVDRFEGTAVLGGADATAIGTLGVVARASGTGTDARDAHPFVGDGVPFHAVHQSGGDVLARFMQRVEEARVSLALLAAVATDAPAPAPASRGGEAPGSGLGIVEGWRGAVVTRVEVDHRGVVSRCRVVDPSFFNWPALSVSLADTIVPDFPLANKSFNLSYAGNDL